MTPKLTQINVGAITSAVYDFANAGDVLPMHDHTPASEHLTAVMRGAAVCRGPGTPPAWAKDLASPGIYDLPAGAHEIEATQPNTRIWNVVKGVAP
jgi:FtsP/CotA-like multicopper oxidase with cupredoxin domain